MHYLMHISREIYIFYALHYIYILFDDINSLNIIFFVLILIYSDKIVYNYLHLPFIGYPHNVKIIVLVGKNWLARIVFF